MKKEDNNLMIVLVFILVLIFVGGYRMMGFNSGIVYGYYGLGWLFGIIAIIAAIFLIYDVLANNRRLSSGMKLLWLILAVFFSIITAIIYYFFGRNNQADLFKKNKIGKSK